ncbi:STAS domain-containing protein [Pseudoruegeria sp. HB172150]|uniref:STAS domain-containing protein n=1 Tax=Pseudoruegeria sp. HB172150 TaxID=2721164 RepID=UPI001554592B|nr:STAS domain-containing protein [Pseudoruegeria sp. HB172150]
MELSFDIIGEFLIFEVSGTVDRTAAGTLYDALVEQVQCGRDRLIVDLSRVTTLTRAGVRGLVVASKLLHSADGQMRICGADKSAEALLRSLSFNHLLKCDPTREASMAAMAQAAPGRPKAATPDVMSLAEFLTSPAEAPKEWANVSAFDPIRTAEPELSVPLGRFVESMQIDYARFLLSDDRIPLDRVAIICGFSDAAMMKDAFLRHLGITTDDCVKPRAGGSVHELKGSVA